VINKDAEGNIMGEVAVLWTMILQRLDALVRQLYESSPDHLLSTTLLACSVALLLLISRLRAGRAHRRLRSERDDLKQQLATVQAAYDSEVRWRTASEKYDASKVASSKATLHTQCLEAFSEG
jgi:hypothetical protein